MKDRIFHIEGDTTFDTGPILEEELDEVVPTDEYVIFKKNDLIHRDNDLPAVVYDDGTKEWYQNDLLHRDNDLPAIIYDDGEIRWYQNGIFIREEYVDQK
jgi:hypothetical protein